MARALAIAGNSANLGGANSCTDRTKTCTVSRLQAAVSELIKSQNPNKTWAFVAELFGLKERAAKYRLANTASYSIEELQALFQSENGLAYLEAMMADSAPKWWRQLQKEIALCKARAAQEAARQLVLSVDVEELDIRSRRQMKRFSDADRRLNVSAARAETAAGLLVADNSGATHRAVAETKRQARGGRR